jgi:hypothetical protein
MKTSIFFVVLFCTICSWAEVSPQYQLHDKIKGSAQILVNTEEYVEGRISEERAEIEETIGGIVTNITFNVDEKIQTVAECATNHTEEAVGVLKEALEVDVANVALCATNYTDKASKELGEKVASLNLGTEEVELPQTAADRGVTFIDIYGEKANAGIEVGENAKARVTAGALENAPSNTVVRSVSIAIGAEADATTDEDSIKNQAIAIGWHAQAKGSNAIAIGGGAQHPDETIETGNATVAKGNTAIAFGYDAKAMSTSSISIGRSAKTFEEGAVQIGSGINTNKNSLQFMDYTVVDSTGQIPTNILTKAADAFVGKVMETAERLYKNGNMTIHGNGSDEQEIEPMVNGLSEAVFEYPEDGIWKAGGECGVIPPMDSRNYNVLITEIPKAQGMTNGVPYSLPPSENFLITFGENLHNKKLMLDVSPSIGFKTGEYMAALTNAPCIIKVREPSTNRVIMVVRPFNIEDL